MIDSLGLMAEKGGLTMWLLGALSVYTLTVVIMKAYQLYQGGLIGNPVAEEVLMLLDAGEPAKAKRHAKSDASPMGIMLFQTMHTIQNEKLTPVKRHAEIQRIGNAILKTLESNLRGLEFAALAGPLLGLLGTVGGMITTFASIEAAGTKIEPALLAGGIWAALLTTVAGLAVAIFATACHYAFEALIDRFRGEMKDAVTRVIEFDAMIAETEQTGNQKKPALAFAQPAAVPATIPRIRGRSTGF